MKKTRLHFTSFPSQIILSCAKKLLQTTGLFLILICFFQEATAQTCSPGTQTFNYTGDVQDFVIPFGINRITIAATGADGGNGASFGGSGGIISADFNVLPGDHIRIIVGGTGTQFAYGSGGGGTAVINCGGAGNCATGTLLIVAGGGGGGCTNGVPGGGATSIAGNGDGGTSLYSLSGGGGGVNGPGSFG